MSTCAIVAVRPSAMFGSFPIPVATLLHSESNRSRAPLLLVAQSSSQWNEALALSLGAGSSRGRSVFRGRPRERGGSRMRGAGRRASVMLALSRSAAGLGFLVELPRHRARPGAVRRARSGAGGVRWVPPAGRRGAGKSRTHHPATRLPTGALCLRGGRLQATRLLQSGRCRRRGPLQAARLRSTPARSPRRRAPIGAARDSPLRRPRARVLQ
jgi:hypothetical protein